MSKVVIYLREQDHAALNTLSQREYRTLRAQAALIIRKELESLGMIEPEEQPQPLTQSSSLSGTERVGG